MGAKFFGGGDLIRRDSSAGRLLTAVAHGGRPAHAYIITGEEGTGTMETALGLAMILNCTGEGERPCGRCIPCRKIELRNHPDVSVVEPTGSSFKIDQVRGLISQIYLKPLEGSYRVMVLTGVERLTAEAGNSLLKVLEEPPGRSVLILLTDNVQALLPTIRSRCQTVSLGSVPPALSAAGDDLKVLREQAFAALDRLRGGDQLSVFELAGELADGSYDLKAFLGVLQTLWRDMLLLRTCPTAGPGLINGDVTPSLERLGEGLPASALARGVEAAERAVRALESNANRQLVLEVTLCNLQSLWTPSYN